MSQDRLTTPAPHSATASGAPLISIVGAGNWMLTHDRIGPRVLELIEGRFGPEVELCHTGHAGLALLDHLGGQELMIVVDACVLEGDPGEIQVIEPDLDAPISRDSSVHQIGPVETLSAARLLYPEQMPGKILLILVETDGIDEDQVEAACGRVVSLVEEIVDKHLNPGVQETPKEEHGRRAAPEGRR